MIQLAIIEDDSSLVSQILNYFETSKEINCNLSASSVESFIAKISNYAHPDILLLDINLPGQSGLEALPELKRLLPNTDIIMFTVQEDEESLFSAFCNGATGYLLKETSTTELNHYVNLIKAGGSAISKKIAQKIITQLCDSQKSKNVLNTKEYQVLELLAEGWSYKLIADRTGLSTDGVRFYIKRIYKALNVNSKGEALRIFYKGK